MSKADNPNANQTINGKWGRIWVGGELWAEVTEFEAKATGEWEELSFCEDLGTQRKLKGWKGEFTIKLKKIYSRGSAIAEQFKTGIVPDIKIVSKLADPASVGHERVELLNVTFSDVTLTKFVNAEIQDDEFSGSFSDYNYLDKIS